MEYDFSAWSDDRLDRRFTEVTEAQQIAHSPERASQIRRELAHLSFELTWRLQDEQS